MKATMVKLKTNRFEKLPESIMTFLISIIGPKTKKPIIAPNGKLDAKLRAIMASEDEHKDKKNASSIIASKARLKSILFWKNNTFIKDWKTAATKAPINKYLPTLKNSA